VEGEYLLMSFVGKKYEKGKRKRGKMQDKKEERGKKKEKEKGERKREKRSKR
jgi:hypothetical protein